MIAETHHQKDVAEILERTAQRWECQTPSDRATMLKSVAVEALRGLVRVEGVDGTMCFLWPIMQKMNEKLELINQGGNHASQS